MVVDFSQQLTVPDDVLFRELDGEAVILNLQTEAYFGLDEVGTRMWTLMTESPTVEAAYAALLAEYDVEPEQLRDDMTELITQLTAHGLLAVDTPAGA